MSGESKLVLDLGCGQNKKKGSIGVDLLSSAKPDVMHDLNKFPYPFESNTVDYVHMDNVLEHLNEPLDVLGEVHRILKPGGVAKIVVPYFRSVWAHIDPTHKHFFTVQSFIYFDSENKLSDKYKYVDYRYRVLRTVFNEDLDNGALRLPLVLFANRFPLKYEVYLSHLLPLDDLTFYIKKV